MLNKQNDNVGKIHFDYQNITLDENKTRVSFIV